MNACVHADIIGLVFNRSFHTVSYTRNGQHLGVACRNVPPDGQSLMIGFGQKGISVEANFGAKPFHFNMDDLLVEEESRHNPGNKEPWRFKEKVCGVWGGIHMPCIHVGLIHIYVCLACCYSLRVRSPGGPTLHVRVN